MSADLKWQDVEPYLKDFGLNPEQFGCVDTGGGCMAMTIPVGQGMHFSMGPGYFEKDGAEIVLQFAFGDTYFVLVDADGDETTLAIVEEGQTALSVAYRIVSTVRDYRERFEYKNPEPQNDEAPAIDVLALIALAKLGLQFKNDTLWYHFMVATGSGNEETKELTDRRIKTAEAMDILKEKVFPDATGA